MKDLLLIVIPSIVTAIIGWFIGRKRENVDLCGERLDNLEKSISVYNKIIDDMSIKIDGLKKEITKLETKIQDLMTENKKLKKYKDL